MLNDTHLRRKSEIQLELLHMLEEEEIYWNKRSNAKWLLKGDNNTKFFHRVANGRKRKNTIFCLQQDDRVIEGDDNLLLHATDFYKQLFGPNEKPLFHMAESCWSNEEKINNDENIALSRPFTAEEVKSAIFSMETNIAPGPDHFPIEFYQKCWIL